MFKKTGPMQYKYLRSPNKNTASKCGPFGGGEWPPLNPNTGVQGLVRGSGVRPSTVAAPG